MTPFELELRKTLDAERARFGNEWLFKWHNISMPDLVDVEDFQGRKFYLGGVRFGGQPQMLYWRAIERYLTAKIHSTFQSWDTVTASYPPKTRVEALEGTARLLQEFVARTVEGAVDTDRRLRGQGYPEQVPRYDASRELATAHGEIIKLRDAHAELIKARKTGLEAKAREHPFVASLISAAVLVPLVGVITRLVFG